MAWYGQFHRVPSAYSNDMSASNRLHDNRVSSTSDIQIRLEVSRGDRVHSGDDATVLDSEAARGRTK